jgi:hypothetical protein
MRYKEGEILEGYRLTQEASYDMLVLTAFLGILIGIIITSMGKVGKQLWMLVWGLGLVVASLYLGIITYFDLPALIFTS